MSDRTFFTLAAAFSAAALVAAWKTSVVLTPTFSFDRSKHPIVFWLWFGLWALAASFCLYFAITLG
jgi:hypothetical protein